MTIFFFVFPVASGLKRLQCSVLKCVREKDALFGTCANELLDYWSPFLLLPGQFNMEKNCAVPERTLPEVTVNSDNWWNSTFFLFVSFFKQGCVQTLSDECCRQRFFFFFSWVNLWVVFVVCRAVFPVTSVCVRVTGIGGDVF